MKHGNQSWSQRCKLTLPANIGPKSTLIESNESSGLGTDRELKQILDASCKIMERGFLVECTENEDDSPKKKIRLSHAKTTAAQLRAIEKERDYYKAKALKYHVDTVHATLVLSQTFEQISKDNSKVKQAGLEHHIVKPNEASPNETNKFLLTKQTANQKTQEMTFYITCLLASCI